MLGLGDAVKTELGEHVVVPEHVTKVDDVIVLVCVVVDERVTDGDGVASAERVSVDVELAV